MVGAVWGRKSNLGRAAAWMESALTEYDLDNGMVKFVPTAVDAVLSPPVLLRLGVMVMLEFLLLWRVLRILGLSVAVSFPSPTRASRINVLK
jgi:hypothetical protein